MTHIWKPIGKPKLLHIPYFAMGANGTTENRVDHVDTFSCLRKELGAKPVAWLKERQGKQFIGLYSTRVFVPPRTAHYQYWLVFRNGETANQFFDRFKIKQLTSPKRPTV